MTGSIFIDLRKVFNLVDHQCLLHKLEHYGIRDKSLKWFENYLTTRLQSVKYNQDISSNLAIGHGVPQGSILGPILFVIYINDLPQCLMKSAIGMYADDTVIYFSATSPGLIKQVLQNDLIYVEQWLQENKLVLNQSKGGEMRDTKTLNLSRKIVSLQVFVDVSRFSPCVINLSCNKNICCGLKKVVAKSRARRSTLSDKFWFCCSFFIKLTTCRATNLLVPFKSTNQRAAFLQPATNVFVAGQVDQAR